MEIKDVDETLRKLLNNTIKPELDDINSIVFDSPANIQEKTSPRLSLFLYDVTENAYLINQELPTKAARPLYIDLHYLLTPFAPDIFTEHILITKILAVLSDNSILSGKKLCGNLIKTGNKELRIIFEQYSIRERIQLWNAFPNTDYRLSLSYTVGPVQIPSSRTSEMISMRAGVES